MTVTSITSNVTFTGDAVTTVFPYAFKIPEEAHLHVYKVTILTGAEVELAQGVDYTFTGIGDDSGGNVTIVPAPSALFQIRIEREVPYTQEMDIPVQGAFFPEVLENTLDIIVMQIQQLLAQLSSSISTARNFILRSVGGTADAVTASTGQSLTQMLEYDQFLVQPVLNNLGAVTLAIDGITALPVLTAAGVDLVADEFHTSRYYGLLALGSPPTELRITSEQ